MRWENLRRYSLQCRPWWWQSDFPALQLPGKALRVSEVRQVHWVVHPFCFAWLIYITFFTLHQINLCNPVSKVVSWLVSHLSVCLYIFCGNLKVWGVYSKQFSFPIYFITVKKTAWKDWSKKCSRDSQGQSSGSSRNNITGTHSRECSL